MLETKYHKQVRKVVFYVVTIAFISCLLEWFDWKLGVVILLALFANNLNKK